MHDADPGLLCVLWPNELHLTASLDPNAAGRWALNPTENLDKRTFARAVRAEQPMDLARGQIEIDASQHHAGRRVNLADTPGRQHRRSARLSDRHRDFFPAVRSSLMSPWR